MVQVGSIVGSLVLQLALVVVVAHVVMVFLVSIYASDFAQGGIIGSGAAMIPSGSGGTCTGGSFGADDSDFADSTTGSGVVYGRGIGQFQKISTPNHRRLPCLNLPLPSEIPKCITPHALRIP